jgi:hypothetical protein
VRESEEGGMKVGLTSVNANNIAITVEERRLGVCVERADGGKEVAKRILSVDTSFDRMAAEKRESKGETATWSETERDRGRGKVRDRGQEGQEGARGTGCLTR